MNEQGGSERRAESRPARSAVSSVTPCVAHFAHFLGEWHSPRDASSTSTRVWTTEGGVLGIGNAVLSVRLLDAHQPYFDWQRERDFLG